MSGSAPTTLGHWTLHEQVGTGGLCAVWRASRPAELRGPGEPAFVALKALHEHRVAWDNEWRLLREGRLLQKLAHPCLPRCWAFADEPRPYIALDLLDGETLSQRLRREGSLPAAEVGRIGNGILRALDHLHRHGVVHRDIKPSNIFLHTSGRVMLLDLGLAADPSEPLTTTLGEVMGTYAYMAPEQLAGAAVDRRTDLYSVGVTLYECLAGTRPVQAKGAEGFARALRSGKISPLSSLCPGAPPSLVETVSVLMARDPMARPASAAIGRALLLSDRSLGGPLHRPPLVGRNAAIGAIEAILDGGGALTVVGEVGSGAGRILGWAVHAAQTAHYETIAIRARPGAAPHAPLEDLQRELQRIVGPVPLTAAALGAELEALSEEGPLLLVVEGIDHISNGSAAVLAQAIAHAPALRTVLAGTQARPVFRSHVVRLRPLTVPETERMVAGMLGTRAPPAGLADGVHRVATGQPAIIAHAIKELITRGALYTDGMGDDGRPCWRLEADADLTPVAGLVRLFGRILLRLPTEARQVLDVLAVVGEAVPLRTALELAGADASGAALHALAAEDIAAIEHHPDGDWAVLRRPAVGQLVLAQVPLARQTEIHRGIAEALEQQPSDPWRDRRIAWHRAHGAGPEDAAVALLELGLQLKADGEATLALEALDRARHLPGTATGVAARLALARGVVLESLARRQHAAEELERARELSMRTGDVAVLGQALTALARTRRELGDQRRATALAEEAVEALDSLPRSEALAEALLESARGERLAGHSSEAVAQLQRCAALGVELGSLDLQARARGAMALLQAEDGRLGRAALLLDEEVAWLRTCARPAATVVSLCRLAIVRRRQGRLDLASAALDEADDVCRFSVQPYERALARIARSTLHLAVDDHRRARVFLDEAGLALDPDAGVELRATYRDAEAELRLATGDLQAALAVFQVAESESEQAGLAAFAAFSLGMCGVLSGDGSAIAQALEVLSGCGDRRYPARLMLHGALVGGDPEALETAEQEVRACGDRLLLLRVLHAAGGAGRRREALLLSRHLLSTLPPELAPRFLEMAAVAWTGLPELLNGRQRRLPAPHPDRPALPG